MSSNLDEIPMLNPEDENFEDNLSFNVWSTQSSDDYRNDRERPYNGQSWTDSGERGKTEVKGLTMRDIKDCLIRAILESAPTDEYFENFHKCWDFSECKHDTDKAKPTQFLLDKIEQEDPDYLHVKAELGTWRPQDVYKIRWEEIDPIAMAQNLTCQIEKMMGIYPNIGTALSDLLEESKEDNKD